MAQSGVSHTVQALLVRFYSPQTNNEEKHAIELKLQEMQNTSFNWRVCLSFMNTIDDSHVWFFAATTVERTANFLWKNLSEGDQRLLRQGLFELFINYPTDVPALQRDKVAKIISTVARQQCTMNENSFAEFVNSVLRLLENKFFLGLALIGAIGDTVTSTEHTQATSFNHIVNHHTANIMRALNQYCGFFVIIVRGDNIQTIFDSINAERKNQYCTQLLNIIQQYFSWMKLDRVEAVLIGNITFLACSWNMLRDGAISAIGALTELLYRNESLPQEAGHQLAVGVFHIIAQETLKLSDDLYQDKVCDLIRQYIKRGWPYQHESKSQMLHQLLEFTFCAKTPHTLMDRINVWTYVCGSRYAEDADQEQCLVGTELVPDFAHKLIGCLKTTLFFRTYPELELLDDEELDENSETELMRYHNQSVDLISQLLRYLVPQMVEETMLSLLERNLASAYIEGNMFFRGMAQSIQGNAQLLQRYEDERMTRICMVDYITACKLITELATILYGKYPSIDFALQQTTIAHIQLFHELSAVLVPLIEMCTKMVSFNTYIFTALAQHIMQIKLFLQLGPSSDLRGDGQGRVLLKVSDTVPYEMKVLLLTTLPLYILHQSTAQSTEWARVTTVVAHLLNIYVSERLLGPKTCSIVFDVLKGAILNSKLLHLEKNTRSLVYRVVCSCLIALHDETGVNPVEVQPALVLQQYVCFIGSTVMEFSPVGFVALTIEQQKQLLHTLTDELEHLTYVMTHCVESQNTAARAKLSNATFRVIEQVLTIFRSTLSIGNWTTKDEVSCRLFKELLEFCNCSVSVLQSLPDMRLMKEVVQLLKDLFITEENLGVHRLRSVQTLLSTLRQLVSDAHNRSLVPDIIQVVINEVLPVVASDDQYTDKDDTLRYEDVLKSLYEVLHDLLHYRWQYFVDTRPLARLEPETRNIVQPEAFLAIMNAYGYALLSNSGYPTVVDTVLTSLDMLHNRRNLYRLPLFTDQLLDDFMKSLLKLAISHVGIIHLEKIVTVLYGMADVDPIRLKVIVCDLGMTHDLNIFHMFQTAEDLPSFRMALNKIINEAKAQPPVCKNFEFLD